MKAQSEINAGVNMNSDDESFHDCMSDEDESEYNGEDGDIGGV